MSAPAFAIAEVQDVIPVEVLRYAFANKKLRGFVDTSSEIEHGIYDKVIDSRIRRKLDIVGPSVETILLKDAWRSTIDRTSMLIQLPIEATKGKRLMGINSITQTRNYGFSLPGAQGLKGYMPNGRPEKSLHAQANKLLAAVSPPVALSTANCEIMSKNVILVKQPMMSIELFVLEGMFSSDEGFTNIPTVLYDRFAEVCVTATQAYIYKECYIKLSRGALHVGKENEEMREIISGYASAEETFKEQWKVFKKAIRVNDPARKSRHNLLISRR